MMTSLAIAISFVPPVIPAWARYLANGLGSVAIGLAALAAYRLTEKIVRNRLHATLCWASASIGILNAGHWIPPALVGAGGAVAVALEWWKGIRATRESAYEKIEVSPLNPPSATAAGSPVAQQVEVTPRDDDNDDQRRLINVTVQDPATAGAAGPSPTNMALDVDDSNFCSVRTGVSIVVGVLAMLLLCFILREVLPKTRGALPVTVFAVLYITGGCW